MSESKVKRPWYSAPKDKNGWPKWVPDLWVSDFRKQDIGDWLVSVFPECVRCTARAKLLSIVGPNLYSFGRHAPPGEQAAVWFFLYRKLGYNARPTNV